MKWLVELAAFVDNMTNEQCLSALNVAGICLTQELADNSTDLVKAMYAFLKPLDHDEQLAALRLIAKRDVATRSKRFVDYEAFIDTLSYEDCLLAIGLVASKKGGFLVSAPVTDGDKRVHNFVDPMLPYEVEGVLERIMERKRITQFVEVGDEDDEDCQY